MITEQEITTEIERLELIKDNGHSSIEVAVRQLIVRMLNFNDEALASNNAVTNQIEGLYQRVGEKLVAIATVDK